MFNTVSEEIYKCYEPVIRHSTVSGVAAVGGAAVWGRRGEPSPPVEWGPGTARGPWKCRTTFLVGPAVLVLPPCLEPAAASPAPAAPLSMPLACPAWPTPQVLTMANQPKSRYYKKLEACKAVPVPRYYKDKAATVASYVYGAFSE